MDYVYVYGIFFEASQGGYTGSRPLPRTLDEYLQLLRGLPSTVQAVWVYKKQVMFKCASEASCLFGRVAEDARFKEVLSGLPALPLRPAEVEPLYRVPLPDPPVHPTKLTCDKIKEGLAPFGALNGALSDESLALLREAEAAADKSGLRRLMLPFIISTADKQERAKTVVEEALSEYDEHLAQFTLVQEQTRRLVERSTRHEARKRKYEADLAEYKRGVQDIRGRIRACYVECVATYRYCPTLMDESQYCQ